MNASFVVLGVLLVVGVALTGSAVWRRGKIAVAGHGSRWPGPAQGSSWRDWPADVNENQHVLGALLIMGTGNVGLVLAGFGLAGAGATAAAVGHQRPGRHRDHGFGTVPLAPLPRPRDGRHGEGVAAFPLLLWALVAGARGLVRAAGGHVARSDSCGSNSAGPAESSADSLAPVVPSARLWYWRQAARSDGVACGRLPVDLRLRLQARPRARMTPTGAHL